MTRGGELSSAEVEATLAAIRQRVRERHGLPPDAPDEPPTDAGRGALVEAMDAAHISAHLPILWDVPVVGRGVALAKRVVRLLLRWYINPIVDQQNDFNGAVARAFVHVTAQQDALGKALEELERRVRALEERAGARVGEPAAPEGRAEE